MQNLVYNPEVKLLLVNQSDEKVNVRYNQNKNAFKLPKIGPRPPYYAHPRYEPYYPII
ncbi:hypothetical protein [Mesobacillus maritimus]|uniref:hypothetical protein n=1 Tax=Mesobacillus maritimus TaxID=1643336 RepID=UPI00385133B8